MNLINIIIFYSAFIKSSGLLFNILEVNLFNTICFIILFNSTIFKSTILLVSLIINGLRLYKLLNISFFFYIIICINIFNSAFFKSGVLFTTLIWNGFWLFDLILVNVLPDIIIILVYLIQPFLDRAYYLFSWL